MNLDWITVLIYIFMILSGWINIYSAVYNEEFSSIFDISQSYGKQLLWILTSLIIGFFILIIDSKFFVSFAYVFYAFFILLLVVVLLVGSEVNGARSWFQVGSFRIQPAEFAKLGASLAIAKILSSYNFTFKNIQNKLSIIAILLVPVILIIFQNDTGSALVYTVFVIPLFREGMSGLILFFAVYFAVIFILSLVMAPIHFIISIIVLAFLVTFILRKNKQEVFKGVLLFLGISIVVWLFYWIVKGSTTNFYSVLLYASIITSIVILVIALMKRMPKLTLICSIFLATVFISFFIDFAFNNILEPHHQDRINDLLGIESDPLGAGYNVNQSKIAIGSGGFLGKGFLKGTQTKYDFVPEQSTDFIFCTVGEEWGFIGTTVIIFAFVFLLIRLVILAERQRSVFSRVFGYCVASIIFFHFSVNIGMTIGLAPVIGIPLPFFSYGGSSLWFFTLLLFIFLRLDASRLEQLH